MIQTVQEEQTPLKVAAHLIEQGEYDEGWDIINDILWKSPDDIPALTAAVELNRQANRMPTAHMFALRVVNLNERLAHGWINLGLTCQALWQMDNAEKCYLNAIERAKTPVHKAMAYTNLAAVNTAQGKWEKGEEYARMALKIDPSSLKSKANLGVACLAQHKWSEGWINYDAIVGDPRYRKMTKYRGEPMWDGSPDKTVFVYGEQGLGDELSFASMIPDTLKVCKKVVIDCDHRLKNLFKRSFPTAKVYGHRYKEQLQVDAEDIELDASISIGQLGRYFRLKDEDFPGTPYLVPPHDRYTMWSSYFKTIQKPVIGIAWSSGIKQTGSHVRKWTLEQLTPLLNAVDAHWVSLQYKDSQAEIDKSGLPIHQYTSTTITSKDYDDTAALVAACDLVICIQTSVGHLAAAMGKEAWVFVSPALQWRYGGTSDKIVWYDSMKLFRYRNGWPIEEAARMLKVRYSVPALKRA